MLNIYLCITDVARNDLIMVKLLHPFWLELARKTSSPCRKILAAAAQCSRRGKFCMREWMRGMHGMRGLPTPNAWRLAGLILVCTCGNSTVCCLLNQEACCSPLLYLASLLPPPPLPPPPSNTPLEEACSACSKH